MALPPQGVPAPTPTATSAPGASQGGIPAWLVLSVALVVTGGTAELLYKVSPAAGYLFALLVVMGYLGFHDRITTLQQFLASVGVPAGK